MAANRLYQLLLQYLCAVYYVLTYLNDHNSSQVLHTGPLNVCVCLNVMMFPCRQAFRSLQRQHSQSTGFLMPPPTVVVVITPDLVLD